MAEQAFIKIDFNRGVTIRQERETGISIYMYKDDPGTYYSRLGKPLSRALAAQAGFPVEEHEKERIRIQRKKLAVEMIDKELAGVAVKGKVLAARNGFKVVDAGYDRANLLDDDGVNYNPKPVPTDIAMKLFETMAGPEVDRKVLLQAKVDKMNAANAQAKVDADAAKAISVGLNKAPDVKPDLSKTDTSNPKVRSLT